MFLPFIRETTQNVKTQQKKKTTLANDAIVRKPPDLGQGLGNYSLIHYSPRAVQCIVNAVLPDAIPILCVPEALSKTPDVG